MEQPEPPLKYSTRTLNRLVLDYEPCCLEFWDNTHFVVGYYHLDKGAADGGEEEHGKNQQRSGGIDVMKVSGSDGDIKQLERVFFETASVFDLHIKVPSVSEEPEATLVAALSNGSLISYKLHRADSSSPESRFQEQTFHRIAPETVFVTAFQFQTDNVISAALSTGEIVLCRLDFSPPRLGSDNGPRTVDYRDTEDLITICQHDLEAWYAVPSVDRNLVLSGADDATLRISDCTSFLGGGDESLDSAPMPPRVDRRIHQAGVTVIHPLSPSIILTGSYDDHLRVVSVPPAGRLSVLAEWHLGGGVWRLQQVSYKGSQLNDSGAEVGSWVFLVSCMYAGVRVVKIALEGGGWDIEPLARFEEHRSMNYASAVVPRADGAPWRDDGGMVSVSTSFYDKLLCVWKTERGP